MQIVETAVRIYAVKGDMAWYRSRYPKSEWIATTRNDVDLILTDPFTPKTERDLHSLSEADQQFFYEHLLST